ncbi:MAG: cupin domain-containing protein [Lactobacillus sp.]|jgi:quercetin dioxygenase-like cupin family protein|nr:cupin domain-containing protein [Lactobacillus sp.]MCH3906342.1 cupin domain-containing protein [Lactobacillus sp.]MCH3990084.1 cupin domain-containing protein [Lactobacillus sp.]MCH4069202.1 cupin domain-containing protein [Lactobacillus sp.]MCI1303504.1 cupin domain-containing protein [Lactobacillus sp.]
MAKNEEEVKNSVFGFGKSNDAFAKYFVGTSYLQPLAENAEAQAAVHNVSFEPGCRNNWHMHSVAQILVAVAGEGWYQAAGEPAKKMKPGDVVIVPPHTKHWHGATKDSWFAHLAIMVGKSQNDWFEPVSDEDYDQLN